MARRGARSAPGGGAMLRQVREKLTGGWTPGLTLLTGDDLYHLDATLRALIAALVPAEEADFALTVFGERKAQLSEVIAAARSLGMFAPRRVVLVRDVAELEGDPEPLVEYAAQPPDSSFLLVRAPKLDQRRKLHQALAKGGTSLVFETAAGADAGALVGEVQGMAAERGLRLDPPAASFLADVCAGDFYRVDTELAKLGCWVGDASGTVGIEAVREVAAGSGLLSGWEVADAVLERDHRGALSNLRQLLEGGAEPLQLLGGLAYRSRSMLQAKALIERGRSPQQAMRAARLWGAPPQVVSRGLGRYTLDELLRFPSLLLEADRSLKSRSLSAAAVLESLLEKMTAPRSAAATGGA